MGGMDWDAWGFTKVAVIEMVKSSIDCWKWALDRSLSRLDARSCSFSNSWRIHWSKSVVGESLSGVLGWRKVWSNTISSTKLSDLVLKRLCSKGKSKSISWIVISFSGREFSLGRGLLLPWPSTVFLFLSNFSGLSTAVTGSILGWDLV